MHLFSMSLWRALQLTSVQDFVTSCRGLFNQQSPSLNATKLIPDIFVWRLDCRLKDIYYLLVIKFMIFGHFWGKIRLFLRSLWRALQLTSVKQLFFGAYICVSRSTHKAPKNNTRQRYLCDGWTVVWSMSATYY